MAAHILRHLITQALRTLPYVYCVGDGFHPRQQHCSLVTSGFNVLHLTLGDNGVEVVVFNSTSTGGVPRFGSKYFTMKCPDGVSYRARRYRAIIAGLFSFSEVSEYSFGFNIDIIGTTVTSARVADVTPMPTFNHVSSRQITTLRMTFRMHYLYLDPSGRGIPPDFCSPMDLHYDTHIMLHKAVDFSLSLLYVNKLDSDRCASPLKQFLALNVLHAG